MREWGSRLRTEFSSLWSYRLPLDGPVELEQPLDVVLGRCLNTFHFIAGGKEQF